MTNEQKEHNRKRFERKRNYFQKALSEKNHPYTRFIERKIESEKHTKRKITPFNYEDIEE